jgi:hypothetical protein
METKSLCQNEDIYFILINEFVYFEKNFVIAVTEKYKQTLVKMFNGRGKN